jgi:branched-chain amino acid transport system substrate-binding protein
MRPVNRSSHKRMWAPAAVLVLALGITACSSSKSDSSGSSASGSASSDSILGAEKKATLPEVEVGLITEGKTTAVDNSAQVPLAEATAKYVNEHLGGLSGHTMKIVGCEANGTPQGATDCANRLIKDNVVAVLQPQFGESEISAKLVLAAGIPLIGYQAGTATELTSPKAYSIGGGIISLAGSVGADVLAKGHKRVAVVIIDLPSATSAVTNFAVPAYTKAGLTADLVPIAPGTADTSSALAIEEKKKPDAYWFFGNPAFCIAGQRGLQALGIDKPVYFINNCVGPALAKAVDIKGSLSGSPIDLDPTDSEFQLYQAVVKQYYPGMKDTPSNSGGAYVATLALARVMEKLTGDVTTTSVNAAMANAKDIKAPLGGGNTFSCGGTAFPTLPALCSTFAFVTPLDADGQPTSYNKVDTSKIFHS